MPIVELSHLLEDDKTVVDRDRISKIEEEVQEIQNLGSTSSPPEKTSRTKKSSIKNLFKEKPLDKAIRKLEQPKKTTKKNQPKSLSIPWQNTDDEIALVPINENALSILISLKPRTVSFAIKCLLLAGYVRAEIKSILTYRAGCAVKYQQIYAAFASLTATGLVRTTQLQRRIHCVQGRPKVDQEDELSMTDSSLDNLVVEVYPGKFIEIKTGFPITLLDDHALHTDKVIVGNAHNGQVYKQEKYSDNDPDTLEVCKIKEKIIDTILEMLTKRKVAVGQYVFTPFKIKPYQLDNDIARSTANAVCIADVVGALNTQIARLKFL